MESSVSSLLPRTGAEDAFVRWSTNLLPALHSAVSFLRHALAHQPHPFATHCANSTGLHLSPAVVRHSVLRSQKTTDRNQTMRALMFSYARYTDLRVLKRYNAVIMNARQARRSKPVHRSVLRDRHCRVHQSDLKQASPDKRVRTCRLRACTISVWKGCRPAQQVVNHPKIQSSCQTALQRPSRRQHLERRHRGPARRPLYGEPVAKTGEQPIRPLLR